MARNDMRWIIGALAAVAITAALRVWLARWLPYDAPVMLFLLVVVLVGYRGGLLPALFAIVLSVLAANVLFLAPIGSLRVASTADAAALGMFVAVALAVSLLGHAHWRSRHIAATALKQLAARTEELERLNVRLTESEVRFRQTFEQAAVGLAHTSFDGTWRWVNDRFAAMLGYDSPAEMIGHRVTEVSPFGELRRDIESARRLMAGEVTTVTRDKHYLRRDGSELWGSLTLSLLRDPSGEPTAFVAVVQDITERRDAERALAERETYMRQLLDSTAEGIYGIDRDGRCTLVNRAALEMLGYERADDLLGENIHDLVHGRRRDGSTYTFEDSPIAQVLSEGREALLDDEVLWCVSGAPLRAEIRAHPILRDEEVIGVVVTFTDVRERKHAEEDREALLASERTARSDAERANRAKEEFVAVVSHELRTPLSAILGWTQILLRNPDQLPTKIRDGLRVIERNARLQSQLVSDLLDVSRILSGRFRLERRTFDIAEVARRTVEGFKPQLDAQGLALEVRIPPHAGEVDGDPIRIEQVLTNLLSNAMKFTPTGGSVRVAVRPLDEDVELCVQDTGRGIEPGFVPLLFDRFRQADPSITRSTGGLGLGLAIVKEIVDRHDGEIRAHSAGEGKGATFVVDLPLAHAGADRPQTPERGGVVHLEGVSLLVVEDNTDTREMLRAIFEERGATVTTAASADEALKKLDERVPDVLVSDIGLPRRDGYELMRIIRNRTPARGGQIPAVALTALARGEDRTRALEAGYQEHLAKPVNLEVLCAAVADLASATAS